MEKRTVNVEFLKAFDDNTWDTEVLAVPEVVVEQTHSDEEIMAWFNGTQMPLAKNRRVVLAAVYNIQLDEED